VVALLASNISTPARQPSLLIVANGVPLNGSCSAQVVSTNYLGADHFTAEVALGADPGFDATFWASEIDIKLDIRVSADGISAPQSLVQGNVDLVTVEPLRGLVLLEGRDLTSLLVQARTQETFANRTSSEIATIVAQRAGLTPIVTATTTLVGRYYQDQHERLTLDQFSRTTTDWDLLVFLAKQEAFDVFVEAQNLYFQQPASSIAPSIVLDVADVEQLRLDRELTLAGPITVAVKSWNTTQQTMVTGSASNEAASGAAPAQNYAVVLPNLTSSQANQLAQTKLNELLVHERRVTARMAGEMTIFPRGQVQLQGTGTAFDQIYTVEEVTRRLGFGSGFTQTVRMRGASDAGPSIPGSLTAASIYA
jgi:phage protein D